MLNHFTWKIKKSLRCRIARIAIKFVASTVAYAELFKDWFQKYCHVYKIKKKKNFLITPNNLIFNPFGVIYSGAPISDLYDIELQQFLSYIFLIDR